MGFKRVKELRNHTITFGLVLIIATTFAAKAQARWPWRHLSRCQPECTWFLGQPVPLFNGKDLAGWTNVEGNAPPTVWNVKDGMIAKSNPVPGDLTNQKTTGDLYAEGLFENFILEFEFKIAKNGNSGVKYKSWNTKGYGLGCEFQIYDDINDGKNKPVYHTGGLYAVYAPFSGTDPVRMDGFNKGKIIVMGNHIEHWLNGQLTVSADVGSCDWQFRVSQSKFVDNPEFGTVQHGRILLQDHGSEVWFKNIVITPLYRDYEYQLLPCQ